MILVYIKVFLDILICIDTVYIRVKEFKKEKVRSSYLAFILILTFVSLFMLKELNTYYITLYLTLSMLIFLILIPFIPELLLSFFKEKTFVNFSKLAICISIILFFIIYFLLYCFDLNINISNYYFKILYKLRYFDFIFLVIYFIFMYLSSKNEFLKDELFNTKEERLYSIFLILIFIYLFRLIFIIMIIPVLI